MRSSAATSLATGNKRYLCLRALQDKLQNCTSLAHEGQWLNECHQQTSLEDTIKHDTIYGVTCWKEHSYGETAACLRAAEGYFYCAGQSAACVDRPFVSLRRYTELLYRGHSFWWRLSECFCAHKKLEVRNNGFIKCYGKAFLQCHSTNGSSVRLPLQGLCNDVYQIL